MALARAKTDARTRDFCLVGGPERLASGPLAQDLTVKLHARVEDLKLCAILPRRMGLGLEHHQVVGTRGNVTGRFPLV